MLWSPLTIPVKQAPLAGVVIDWFHVQMSDGNYVYMLSLRKVAVALKLHPFTASRFCKSKGWNPCGYESYTAAHISTSMLKLNVGKKTLAGNGVSEAHLLTCPQVTEFIAYRAFDGDEYCQNS